MSEFSSPMSTGRRGFADPGKRIVAYLIDIVPNIILNVLGAIIPKIAPIFTILSLAYSVYNHIYLQGTTGQTIGKKQQGIRLGKYDSGAPIGIGGAIIRWILGSILVAVCLLDLIIMLTDKEKRRLTDKILGNAVFDA